jgi:hypothetical protein
MSDLENNNELLERREDEYNEIMKSNNENIFLP